MELSRDDLEKGGGKCEKHDHKEKAERQNTCSSFSVVVQWVEFHGFSSSKRVLGEMVAQAFHGGSQPLDDAGILYPDIPSAYPLSTCPRLVGGPTESRIGLWDEGGIRPFGTVKDHPIAFRFG